MDKDFEEKICRDFFDKRVSDRLTFELRSLKKRCEFIRKLSHTAEKYLNVKKIFRQFETPPDPELIKGFLGSEMCYVISHGDNDGNLLETAAALDELYLNNMAYMLIGSNGETAYLETENEYSRHRAYFLKG